MTRKLKVLIIDKNQVFVAGIKLILQTHFHAKDIKLIFTSDKSEYSIADIIFWATGYPATIDPICVLDRRFHDKLIIIGSPSKNHTVDNGTEKIYYRHQCGSRLIELTENVLKKTSIDPDASLSLKYDPFSLMTSRQKEVLNYVSAGMNPNEIADKMQINEKTVSGHKRAAMNKLQLKKTTELYHWLCINNVINS